MEGVLRQTIRLLESGENAVWATIIDRSGSAPRAAGSRLVVDRHGYLVGSVGGGRLEAEALAGAAQLHRDLGCRLLSFDLTSQEVSESEMICGGKVSLWLEGLGPGHLPLLRQVRELLARGHKALWLTRLSEGAACAGQERHMIWGQDGDQTGSLELSPWERSEAERLFSLNAQGLILSGAARPPLFADVFKPLDRLYLFGGGHVSLAVAWLAARVGFSVVVLDDREEYANPARFPMAEETIALPFDECFAGLAFGERDYVAIMTRGHLFDLEVLRQAVSHNPRYLGMIGSRRKRQMIYARLSEEGISPQRLAQVYSPIGLDIGAQTPEELAVSIVAELVAARAGCLDEIKAGKKRAGILASLG